MAVAVHCANGIWGTVADGLFNTTSGLFYGGGFYHLGVQCLGVVTIGAYAVVTMLIVFKLIDKTIGLRVTPEEETVGLDVAEHALASAYADFLPAAPGALGGDFAYEPVDVGSLTPVTLPTAPAAGHPQGGMTKLTIICREERFSALRDAMAAIGVTGMTVTQVLGYGRQKGRDTYYRGVKLDDAKLLPKVKVEVVVSKVPVETVIEAARKALYTGHVGDGKIFVYDVENVVKVRTGEEGYDALQDAD